jgi:hypothetical protein
MQKTVSPDLVEQWLRGWSLSREVSLPVPYKSGYRVDVGWEKQKTRYVFPQLNQDFIALANAIDEPWVFLKVCAPPGGLSHLVPGKWVIQPQGYMMTCFRPMIIKDIPLHNDYTLSIEEYNSTYVVKVVAQNGNLASIGRLVLVDDLAIYDRISTAIDHRRNGLARFLMKELQKIAVSKGVIKNFLVATEEGRLLYQSLGWELYCLYTTIVIPGTSKGKDSSINDQA